MLLPALILFSLFLLLSAFFSSSETAFIATAPFKIKPLEKEGNRKAKLVRKMSAKIDNLLATILIGNTLVNAAAASIATSIFVSFIPDKNQAVLYATILTTFLILIFSEITPKTYAAHDPVKLSLLFVRPLRFFVVVFYPVVKAFMSFSRLVFPSLKKKDFGMAHALSEKEIKFLLSMGIKGMSTLRKKMIDAILEIGSRPVKEIMIPWSQTKTVEINAPMEEILHLIQSEGHSRFPVYRESLDNIAGVIHAKDLIPSLVKGKEHNLEDLLRPPLFIPESSSLESTLRMMLDRARHLVFIVNEFGNIGGIVTMEDILEEIVGEIQDEHDPEVEELITRTAKDVYVLKGKISINELNKKLSLGLPLKKEYTTLAGYFLNEFGRIPKKGDTLDYNGYSLTVEKMAKRHIETIRIDIKNTN